MKIIIGLGNPGKKYENTRHNAGFMVMDALANLCDLSFDQDKFSASFAKGKSSWRRCDLDETNHLYE